MLPTQYAWLAKEPAPRMLLEGLKTFGTTETPGAANNPIIMKWAKEAGPDVAKVYAADSVPWCGLWMAVVAKRSGKPAIGGPLWAQNWAAWGQKSPKASLGDILVFKRPGGGHVGLYVGEDATAYHVLGGNQSDKVKISRVAKSQCIAVRRFYATGKPANVRAIKLAASGATVDKLS